MLLRLLSIPLELFRFPGRFISGIWQDGGRGQFLVMGVPSVLVMAIGLFAVILAYSIDSDLKLRYHGLAQQARGKAMDIRKALQGEAGNSGISNLPKDDSRIQELKIEEAKEKIFLEKLVDLDSNDPEHKYQLAELAFYQNDPQRGESLLQVIAPFDEPGYAKAHLVLAQRYLNKTPRTDQEKKLNMARAESQIDQALVADESNVEAKRIKASIFVKQRKFLPAYQIYEDLFDDDPVYFRPLLDLAKVLGKDSDQQSILSQASRQYKQKIDRKPENVSEWVNAWNNYVLCLKLKKDFRTAENALITELKSFRGDVGKEVFIKRELSKVYSERAISRGRDASSAVQRQQLSDLSKAIENNPKNHAALQWLTILGNSPEVGEEARKIYDPRYDSNSPSVVLSELGHQALKAKEYEQAITFFERARKKNPRNPQVLNNLAFAYLVSDRKNPEQALLLVDQAIIFIKNVNLGAKREEIISSFFDTRGEALMQLNRMGEAAASFEIAFRSRQDSVEIIGKLVKCYAATGNERQAESYRRRIEKLKKQELDNSTPSNND